MSIHIRVTITCDRCLVAMPTMGEHRIGQAHWLCSLAKDQAIKEGWIIVPRGRYHTPAYYCPTCADKPMRPLRDTRKRRTKA